MSKEVLQAIKAVCDEKHIPVESVLTTIEQALAAAYRKDYGNKMQNLRVEFDPATMNIKVFDVKTVVEDQELDEEGNVIIEDKGKERDADEEKTGEGAKKTEPAGGAGTAADKPEDEEKRFNPKTDIMISRAREIKPDAKIGDEIVIELPTPGEFGRMAAQTAKQVIIQRLREAERDVIFNEYKDKEGELINGTVQRIESGNVLVDIGQATAVLPLREQVKNEKYAPGAQLRFYIKSVSSTSRGPEVLISRTSTELVKKLFAIEVPEIDEGTVEIKSIAREPGNRTKIAVLANEEGIDAVGSCVGQRGTRVQFIINELSGEKIDIIEWDEDVVKFIKNALSPAKVISVRINEAARTAAAYVAEDQFSLAIGKQGQNVRLASELAGWRIDIKMESPSVGAPVGEAGDAEDKKDAAGKSENKKDESGADDKPEAKEKKDDQEAKQGSNQGREGEEKKEAAEEKKKDERDNKNPK